MGSHKIGESVCQNARLAGSRTGEDEKRTARVKHGLTLGRVKALEEILGIGAVWHGSL